LKIAFFGDIVGKPGRRAAAALVPRLREEYKIHLVFANVENAAGGFGVNEKTIKELKAAGIDFMTSGNHIWDKKEGLEILDSAGFIVRPANFPGFPPGRGYGFAETDFGPVGVLNLQGRVFMPPIDCPFSAAGKLIADLERKCKIIIVDFHGEATSEKIAMGWHLDGRVSLVVGTHTHVPTSDQRILPGGTGYVTDIGMTGSYDSVLGVEKKAVLQRFLTMRPVRFDTAAGDVRADIIIGEIDEKSAKTVKLEHIQLKIED